MFHLFAKCHITHHGIPSSLTKSPCNQYQLVNDSFIMFSILPMIINDKKLSRIAPMSSASPDIVRLPLLLSTGQLLQFFSLHLLRFPVEGQTEPGPPLSQCTLTWKGRCSRRQCHVQFQPFGLSCNPLLRLFAQYLPRFPVMPLTARYNFACRASVPIDDGPPHTGLALCSLHCSECDPNHPLQVFSQQVWILDNLSSPSVCFCIAHACTNDIAAANDCKQSNGTTHGASSNKVLYSTIQFHHRNTRL